MKDVKVVEERHARMGNREINKRETVSEGAGYSPPLYGRKVFLQGRIQGFKRECTTITVTI